MLVLDLDGVVTDPHSGQVDQSVLAAVISDLKRGVAVAFNTGRAIDWVQANILPTISAACSLEELARLLVIVEKGGVIGRFEQDKLILVPDQSLDPPTAFKRAFRELVEDPAGPYAAYMFWDARKQTLATIERRPEVSVAAFHDAQKQLTHDLERLLDEHHLPHFKIDATIIATDVQHETAGKHLGAEHILTWLKEQGIAPQSFAAIGDSPSDAAMADVFIEAAPTTFVYVGDPAKFSPPAAAKYKTVITGGGYSRDTAKFLQSPLPQK